MQNEISATQSKLAQLLVRRSDLLADRAQVPDELEHDIDETSKDLDFLLAANAQA